FGEYNPENFDRDFLGPLRASDALALSRNVPAVSLAAQLSRPTLYEFLRRAGVPLPEPESYYGLALPLGGAEVTMQDLVRLYAALANNGELRSLRRTSRDPISRRGLRILSPEASFLSLQMLGNVPRPEMNCADATNSAPVYWKTGTSHGFRDAWSIGVFDHYVLAVWIGNFDGRANGAFVGRSAAAPLFFQIIDSLRANWPEPNERHSSAQGANLNFVAADVVRGPGSATPATGANLLPAREILRELSRLCPTAKFSLLRQQRSRYEQKRTRTCATFTGLRAKRFSANATPQTSFPGNPRRAITSSPR